MLSQTPCSGDLLDSQCANNYDFPIADCESPGGLMTPTSQLSVSSLAAVAVGVTRLRSEPAPAVAAVVSKLAQASITQSHRGSLSLKRSESALTPQGPRSSRGTSSVPSSPYSPSVSQNVNVRSGDLAAGRPMADQTRRLDQHLQQSTSLLDIPSTFMQQSPSWCDRQSPSITSPRQSFSSSSTQRRSADASSRLPRGDVSVCVRLRPGNSSANHQDDRCATPCHETPGSIRLRQIGGRYDALGEASYQFDHVFHEDASQEEVFNEAVAPICEAVISGYNGAVIAYGQTGSGKTHTVVGSTRVKGIAPRAITRVFDALSKRRCWSVEVSVLEIYNERVRDLLASGSGVTTVDVHEVRGDHEGSSFRCPEATRRQVTSPDEALAALTEGMKRRETSRTDMNHNSSRSHLIFTLSTSQSDPEIGATLRGRLHLVDLAGSERLKRSMSSDFASPRGGPTAKLSSRNSGSLTLRSPRDQRREAGEINKSLSQLALVIQRLTNQANGSLSLVPYRDSMLTRLLAESFGGSSKTCLIITCSAQAADREETRCSLEFGKRAKLVRNKAEINLEVAQTPSAVMEALMAKKMEEMQRSYEDALADRELLQAHCEVVQAKLSQAVDKLNMQQSLRLAEAAQFEDQRMALQRRFVSTIAGAVEVQDSAVAEAARLQEDRQSLHAQLTEAASAIEALRFDLNNEVKRRVEVESALSAQLSVKQDQLDSANKQVSMLRSEVAEMAREKAAAVARLEKEIEVMRARWLEDTTRLEQEKEALVVALESERADNRQKLEELLRKDRSIDYLHTASVEEAKQRERDALEDAALSTARLAGRGAELRRDLEVATLDVQKLERLRQARIESLESEARELTMKWKFRKDQTMVVAEAHEDLVHQFDDGQEDQEANSFLPSFPSTEMLRHITPPPRPPLYPVATVVDDTGPVESPPYELPTTRLATFGQRGPIIVPSLSFDKLRMMPD